MLASQSFITSVVVGKDIVPRIGLHQLEMLRHQLVETLHTSKTPKVNPFSFSIRASRERETQLIFVDQAMTTDKVEITFPRQNSPLNF